MVLPIFCTCIVFDKGPAAEKNWCKNMAHTARTGQVKLADLGFEGVVFFLKFFFRGRHQPGRLGCTVDIVVGLSYGEATDFGLKKVKMTRGKTVSKRSFSCFCWTCNFFGSGGLYLDVFAELMQGRAKQVALSKLALGHSRWNVCNKEPSRPCPASNLRKCIWGLCFY